MTGRKSSVPAQTAGAGGGPPRGPSAGGDDGGLMPLGAVPEGAEVLLVRVDCGRGGRHRLAEMGLTPGVRLRVLSRGPRGPLIVLVKGTRLMIGRGIVPRVFVRPA